MFKLIEGTAESDMAGVSDDFNINNIIEIYSYNVRESKKTFRLTIVNR